MNEQEIKARLAAELEKVGLSLEFFQAVLGLSPARQIVPGYPQQRGDTLSIQENW